MFRHSKPKLVLRSKQTMRLAETDHVIFFNQSHGLFTTKYKFWFTISKHQIDWTAVPSRFVAPRSGLGGAEADMAQ